jgi:hypothetical protein
MSDCRMRHSWAINWGDPLLAEEMIPLIEPVIKGWLRRKPGWWFAEPLVFADPYGRLIFSVTIIARDRWDCHRRAVRVAAGVAAATKTKLNNFGDPAPAQVPKHSNRGQGRRGPTGFKRPCGVPSCEDTARTRGWCQPHYQRWRRWGDPEGMPPPKETNDGPSRDSREQAEQVRTADSPYAYYWGFDQWPLHRE